MGKKNKGLNATRQNFLLTFFSGDSYQEKEVNGFWLVKQLNGETRNWQVAIYNDKAFKKYKSFN